MKRSLVDIAGAYFSLFPQAAGSNPGCGRNEKVKIEVKGIRSWMAEFHRVWLHMRCPLNHPTTRKSQVSNFMRDATDRTCECSKVIRQSKGIHFKHLRSALQSDRYQKHQSAYSIFTFHFNSLFYPPTNAPTERTNSRSVSNAYVYVFF